MESVKDPNKAVAASTAVAIAMPLVIALVVLPTASSSVRIREPAGLTSPDISAMPCALSDTGPKVSMATMTPTVVSSPHPASAIANRPTTPAPPSSTAPAATNRGSSTGPVKVIPVPKSSKREGRYAYAATTESAAPMPADIMKARLIVSRPFSSGRGRVRYTPASAVSTPTAGMMSGNTNPDAPNAALPRTIEATSVTAYDSNRSAAMPAQSPTLSPTLSAIVAALRGHGGRPV